MITQPKPIEMTMTTMHPPTFLRNLDLSKIQTPKPKRKATSNKRKPNKNCFPVKLHRMLSDAEQEGNSWIVSWISEDGFQVHDQEAFVASIMPRYFRQTKWRSFTRQLQLYGFVRQNTGPHKGAYRHSSFQRYGNTHMLEEMRQSHDSASQASNSTPEASPAMSSMKTPMEPKSFNFALDSLQPDALAQHRRSETNRASFSGMKFFSLDYDHRQSLELQARASFGQPLGSDMFTLEGLLGGQIEEV